VNIPRFAVNNKSLVLAAFALAMLWSVFSFISMQRREDPQVLQRRTELVTIWAGASTENVEQLITKKISDDLRAVTHVDHVEGISRPGISDVAVFFDDGTTDADAVLHDVRNHVADIKSQLPAAVIGPSILDDIWKTYPILLGISVDGDTPRQLRDFATTLKDQIGPLSDVGDVRIAGVQEQSIDVDIDLRKLDDFGITANDVVNTLAARNAIVPSASVALNGRLAQIAPDSELRGQTDVAETAIAAPGGRLVRIGDIADVKAGYPDPPSELIEVNGKPGIVLAIQAKATSSLTSLGPQVRRYLSGVQSNWPPGVHVTFLADQPRETDERVNDFWLNLCLAVAIVTVLVALFMGLRNGLLVGMTVAISITLTFGVMPLFGVDFNQISLLALIVSLGIIVDAGIVAIDNIENLLCTGLDRKTAAWRGVQDLWFPLLTSTLVAISSFLPFRFVGGGSIGDFISALGVVTTIALAISLVVAYFITPILGEWFAVASQADPARGPRAATRRIFDGLLDAMGRAYVPLATASLARPILTVGIAAISIVVALLWIPQLGIQFFPAADRNQLSIDVNAPEGTDIARTASIVDGVGRLLAASPGVTSYGAFVGQGAPRFYYNLFPEQPKPSYAQLLVNADTVAAANALTGTLRNEIARTIAGARIDVKRFEQGPPVGPPIQIRLAGANPATLARLSERMQSILKGIPGTSAVRDSLGVPTSKVVAHIDEARAAYAGVNDADVQQLLSLAYGGVTATSIREADRQTPVIVRLPPNLRHDTNDLFALAVRNTAGSNVPLGELVSLEPSTQTSIATLRDGQPTVTVIAEVQGRLASGVLTEFRHRLDASSIPAGVTVTYAGEYEELEKSFRNLGIALTIGLLINQTVLLWEFRSLRLSLVVLSAVPLGVVGAIFGLAVSRSHFGFVGALGIASLGGIVTNHAIVLFEYAKRELDHGRSMEHALITAGTKRLRPIMLTVTASIAGLIPLALSSQTLWRPFCFAVIFGLACSMFMTLVAIPALYRLICGRKATNESPDHRYEGVPPRALVLPERHPR
jgi:multidrug efflux pump